MRTRESESKEKYEMISDREEMPSTVVSPKLTMEGM
jgi:hypothetical protein